MYEQADPAGYGTDDGEELSHEHLDAHQSEGPKGGSEEASPQPDSLADLHEYRGGQFGLPHDPNLDDL